MQRVEVRQFGDTEWGLSCGSREQARQHCLHLHEMSRIKVVLPRGFTSFVAVRTGPFGFLSAEASCHDNQAEALSADSYANGNVSRYGGEGMLNHWQKNEHAWRKRLKAAAAGGEWSKLESSPRTLCTRRGRKW